MERDECADESFEAAVVEVCLAEAGAEEVAAVVLQGHADLDGLGKTSHRLVAQYRSEHVEHGVTPQ